MKNKISIVLIFSILLITTLGCGYFNTEQEPFNGVGNTNSNKTITDRAVDTAIGEGKTGIAECDEVMDMVTAYANNPDDGYIVKAGKAVVFNRIKESVRKSIEDNKGDPKEIAKNCREIKAEIEKYKAQEESKKKTSNE